MSAPDLRKRSAAWPRPCPVDGVQDMKFAGDIFPKPDKSGIAGLARGGRSCACESFRLLAMRILCLDHGPPDRF